MNSDPQIYRPNVGIALFNGHGRVFLARRMKDDGPEVIFPGHEWQFPQGGIEAEEDPYQAALRELHEETGVIHAAYLSETDWISYDFPPYSGPPHRLARYRGQRQKWFALKFTGDEAEIDIHQPRGGEPEFDAWRWERLDAVAALVVPFKRHVYKEVEKCFCAFV
jgi:putative (di)nucleoside polyphosphate hydrolase